MLLTGNYPFTIRIFNSLDPALGVDFLVKRRNHLSYFTKEKDSKGHLVMIEKLPEESEVKQYTIEGGESLAFPMYFGDESLVLSSSGNIVQPFTISIGSKAKCIPNKVLGEPKYGEKHSGEKNKEDFYTGGVWSITPEKEGWALTIQKLGPDPEDEDVVTGPDEPD